MEWLLQNQGLVFGVLGVLVGWFARGRKDVAALVATARAIVDQMKLVHPELGWLQIVDKALTEFERVTGMPVTNAVVGVVEKRAKEG